MGILSFTMKNTGRAPCAVLNKYQSTSMRALIFSKIIIVVYTIKMFLLLQPFQAYAGFELRSMLSLTHLVLLYKFCNDFLVRHLQMNAKPNRLASTLPAIITPTPMLTTITPMLSTWCRQGSGEKGEQGLNIRTANTAHNWEWQKWLRKYCKLRVTRFSNAGYLMNEQERTG